MNIYIDAIKLNCEQFLNKYPHRYKVYDFTNTYMCTTLGIIAGLIFAEWV